MRSCSGERQFEAIIFGADNIGAVDAFEPPHSEMTARDILEMLDKSKIDGCPAKGAEDRDGLRGELLRHDETKARSDLRQKSDKERRSFADGTLVDREIGDLDEAAGEHRADGEIIGIHALFTGGRAAERKDLETGEPGPRVAEILAFLPRDRSNRAQHDRRRNGQLDCQSDESKGAANRPRRAGEPRMQNTSARKPRIF